MADRDDQLLRLALASVADNRPSRAAPALIAQLERSDLDPEVRLLVIRLLGTMPSPRARDWFLKQALAKRRWRPGKRLAAKSPELLAIIAALAAHWTHDTTAAAVLQLAAESSDGDIRAAAARGRDG